MLDSVLQDLFKLTASGDPELHHALDPLDVDYGPFQTLAVQSRQGETEQAPETGSVAV